MKDDFEDVHKCCESAFLLAPSPSPASDDRRVEEAGVMEGNRESRNNGLTLRCGISIIRIKGLLTVYPIDLSSAALPTSYPRPDHTMFTITHHSLGRTAPYYHQPHLPTRQIDTHLYGFHIQDKSPPTILRGRRKQYPASTISPFLKIGAERGKREK